MKTINAHTKVSTVLREHPGAMDALVAIHPRFDKLRNPLLRRLLAGRTTLAAAAAIGGCTLQEIAAALGKLGFVWEGPLEEAPAAPLEEPAFMALADRGAERVLDVRSDLEAGKDPLKKIMAAVQDLPEGQLLRIINTFEPAPLISLLAKQGFAHHVRQPREGEVHTYFYRSTTSTSRAEAPRIPEMTDPAVFARSLRAFGERLLSLDVRQMEMPMPLVTILEALSTLPEHHALSVWHRRVPVFLFSELEDRGFHYLMHRDGDEQVRLLIFREQELRAVVET